MIRSKPHITRSKKDTASRSAGIEKSIPYNIRPAVPTDSEKIKRVHYASITKICSRDYTKKEIKVWWGKRTAQAYKNAMKDGESMLVAVTGSKILGFASLKDNEVKAVYVHPKYVGTGIGKRLLNRIERIAEKRGYRKIFLSSTITSVKFYLKQGYRRIGNGLCKVASVRMRKNLVA